MPSYINAALPSYYASDFPKTVSGWKLVREFQRLINQTAVNKMRIAEWAVRGLYHISAQDKAAAENRAEELVKAELIKDKSEQHFGNLLAMLKSKVGSGSKDHEQIEEMFKFMLGVIAPRESDLFNELLNIAVDYAQDHNIPLDAEVLNYDATHRVISAEPLILRPSLAPKHEPDADADADAELIKALNLSLLLDAPTMFTPMVDANKESTAAAQYSDATNTKEPTSPKLV